MRISLRGVLRDLARRGHQTLALEPQAPGAEENLVCRPRPGDDRPLPRHIPDAALDGLWTRVRHEAALDDADVVVVHEWTDPALVAGSAARARPAAASRFSSTIPTISPYSSESEISGSTSPAMTESSPLANLAAALSGGWLGQTVFTWHEAADDALFHPCRRSRKPAT